METDKSKKIDVNDTHKNQVPYSGADLGRAFSSITLFGTRNKNIQLPDNMVAKDPAPETGPHN